MYKRSTWHSPERWRRSWWPARFADWLTTSKSMTRRMKRRCKKVNIEVLFSAWGRALPDECEKLQLLAREQVFIREIMMICDNEPWLYARTIIPQKALIGKFQRIKNLNNVPLGKVLYKDTSIKRTPFEVALIQPENPFCKKLEIKQAVWARRSMFIWRQKEILLSEIFLPKMQERLEQI